MCTQMFTIHKQYRKVDCCIYKVRWVDYRQFRLVQK